MYHRLIIAHRSLFPHPHLPRHPRREGVGYGDGEAVGGVVWPGDLAQVQEGAHHLLDLALVRPAVGGDRLLDLQRRVLVHLDPGPVRGKHRHAPRLSDRDRRGHVGVEEELLDSDGLGPVTTHQFCYTIEEPPEPSGHLPIRRRNDGPVLQVAQAVALVSDHTPPHRRSAGVYAEYGASPTRDHGLRLLPPASACTTFYMLCVRCPALLKLFSLSACYDLAPNTALWQGFASQAVAVLIEPVRVPGGEVELSLFLGLEILAVVVSCRSRGSRGLGLLCGLGGIRRRLGAFGGCLLGF